MKRIWLYTLLPMLLPCLGQSQITLGPDDIPAFGTVLSFGVDTLPFEPGIGQAAAEAQTWSFLGLSAGETFDNTVVDPAATPAGGLFPNATFAFEASNGLYAYATLTEDALLAAGGSAPGPTGEVFTVAFNPGQQLLPVPATYGSSFSSTFGFQLEIDGSDFGADSIRIIEQGSVTAEIDAFGEVTVPAGTFEALRQRSEVITNDSIYAKVFGFFILVDVITDTTVTYEWWAADGVGSVCSIDFDTEGNPTSATFLTAVNGEGASAPVAAFSFEQAGGGTVQFTDNSQNGPVSWLWDFGDGTDGSTAQNPGHTYAEVGAYVACLTVTNALGSDVACQTVDIISQAGSQLPGKAAMAFPNPAAGPVQVELHSWAGRSLKLELYHATGQLLWQQSWGAAPAQLYLPLDGQPSGAYLLRISDGAYQQSVRLLRQ
ncbi:PKD domain-containing protein [Phaeodactylibacter luteus]|uniref:PKD domain-containing protein n=1 Tax=Phaeodactylibacter luteus TaxID=1564516 RepID=A0A5C6RF64_9BACT|nr:PKD domain-containing protein [Phaeodactylibacter luteus]TXB59740.1 PKD domain-containing protein [Phaeodactylibacter luteus]